MKVTTSGIAPSTRRIKRNTYIVRIPRDFTENKVKALNQAIEEAMERTRKYFMPCNWEAKRIGTTPSNHICRVTRFHY